VMREVDGLGSGAKIPDPTNFYKEQSMAFFRGEYLRFSQTVSILNTRDGTYLGPRYNPVLEDFELYGNFKEPGPDTLFEVIDAGTFSNAVGDDPTKWVNTEPREPDLDDSCSALDGKCQKSYVRFNETMILRSEKINRYISIVGTNFHAQTILSFEVDRSTQLRVLPVFTNYQPHLNPVATNDNLQDENTYVKNGTKIHLLNNQQNFMQKIANVPKVVMQGPGTSKKGMWKDSDIFQLLMLKRLEE